MVFYDLKQNYSTVTEQGELIFLIPTILAVFERVKVGLHELLMN